MVLTSPAFIEEGTIPRRYTCEGDDVSPALTWTGLPPATQSLALIVDDPDAPDPAAPRRTFVHWVLYNIPAGVKELLAGVAPNELPPPARAGVNDFGHARWGGPCPPIGRHRYVFKLYALDATLPEMVDPTKADLERAMRNHVLDETRLVATYQKGDP